MLLVFPDMLIDALVADKGDATTTRLDCGLAVKETPVDACRWGLRRGILARCHIVATAHSVDDECQALPGARLPPPPGLGERATLGLEPSRLLPTCDCVAWTSEATAARTHQAKPTIITALIMAQFRIKKVDWGGEIREIMSFSQQRVFYVTNQNRGPSANRVGNFRDSESDSGI
jgi:hypothetical protein